MPTATAAPRRGSSFRRKLDFEPFILLKFMPNNEAWEKTWNEMFNWAEQIKEAEIDRWKIMYGFTPSELKSWFSEQLTLARREEKMKVLEEINDINWTFSRTGISVGIKKAVAEEVVEKLSLLSPTSITRNDESI